MTAAEVTDAGRSAKQSRLGSRIAQYVLLVVIGVLAIAPIYWVLTSSVKQSGDIYQFPPDWFPTHWRWANFSEAWDAAPFDRFYLNSIVVTVLGTAGQITVALFCAYAFSFLPFPAKGPLFLVMLGAMMVPGNVVLMPNYLTIAHLGWVNTYQGLIVPHIGSVFAMFLLRQHMLTLPGEVMEAAKVDGASHLRILWQVVLPMSRPMAVTVIIVSIVERWNDFIWPLVSTSVDSMRTLPVGLLQLQNAEGYTNWGAVMAASVFVVVPVLIVFFVAQRHIIAGLTQGATKG